MRAPGAVAVNVPIGCKEVKLTVLCYGGGKSLQTFYEPFMSPKNQGCNLTGRVAGGLNADGRECGPRMSREKPV